MKKMLLLILLLMTTISSHAATIVEIDSDEGKSTLYSDGKMAKVTMEGETDYMVLDSEAETFQVVMDKQKMIMDMTSLWTNAPAATSTQDSRVKINSIGTGPKLVGYQTKQYDLLVDGKYCGSVFSSTKALADSRLARIFVMFQTMAAKTQSLIPTGMMQEDHCDSEAKEQLIARINEIGMPLKVLNKDRKVDYQIAKITLDTQLPANVFDIPQHYKVQNMQQMQQAVGEQMQKHMPKIEKLIQQSGQDLPPAAAEQIQKLQQMMEQMQKN